MMLYMSEEETPPAKKEPPALQPLISLAIAAGVTYARATGKHTKDVGTLNNVARLIASHTRVFTRESGDAAMLMPDELMEGYFDEGGALFRFRDLKRKDIGDLVILVQDLGRVVEVVQKLYDSQSR
jgi:hypothetical protein